MLDVCATGRFAVPYSKDRSSAPSKTCQVRVAEVCAEARRVAETVDKESRFPSEAISALKGCELLDEAVPHGFGGRCATTATLADICYSIGQRCLSTAMIYAMHSVHVLCIARHAGTNTYLQQLMCRLSNEQLLLASSTTEAEIGGNARLSAGAIEREGSRLRLVKEATVISYGAEADGIIVTARRAPDAAPTDQVLLALGKGDYQLAPLVEWHTMGMRGTQSAGFRLTAETEPDRQFAEPYSVIHHVSMVPNAHILWSAAWAGAASDAIEKVRLRTRKVGAAAGSTPPTEELAQAIGRHNALCALILEAAALYERLSAQELLGSRAQVYFNTLKVQASQLSTSIVLDMLSLAGLAGYRLGDEASLSRHIRDLLSSGIMINNRRILAQAGAAALLAPVRQHLVIGENASSGVSEA